MALDEMKIGNRQASSLQSIYPVSAGNIFMEKEVHKPLVILSDSEGS